MSRPKELIDRIAIERVVSQGVVPEGNAVPEARPGQPSSAPGTPTSPSETQPNAGPSASLRDKPVFEGPPSRISGVMPQPGVQAEPAKRQTTIGATANPRTGVPDIPVDVEVKPNAMFAGPSSAVRTPEVSPGSAAGPRTSDADKGRPAAAAQRTPAQGNPASPVPKPDDPGRVAAPRPQQPFKVGDARVYSPETFAGKTATPKILEAIMGVPAGLREKQSFTGTAQVTPQTQVSITVPPAFPLDPKELFATVDSLINLPPRQEPTPRRNLALPVNQTDLESTESFVARSFAQNVGNTTDLDRWEL